MRKPYTSASSSNSTSRTCSWTNSAPGSAVVPRCCGSGWSSTPVQKILPVLHLGPRTQNAAHTVVHSLRHILAPGCLPLFTSDGLNLYFYALTAHFGHWLARRVIEGGKCVSGRWRRV